MADLWQQNGILIGIALVVALALLILLLSKGRRKVQIERDDAPADTAIKRNQALIDLPPAASATPLVTPTLTPEVKAEPAVVEPAAPSPSPSVATPTSVEAAAPVADANVNTGTIVTAMPAPDPTHEPAVVVQSAPQPVAEQAENASAVEAAEQTEAAPASSAIVHEAIVAAVATQQTSNDPDELTRIKGLGPKLAETLRALGVVSFAQIAAWDEAAIDRIDDQLGRFKGRIRRDNWVEQARLLADGNIAGYEDRFGKI